MESGKLANMIEVRVADFLGNFKNSEVTRITPSVQSNRRYVGVSMDTGEQFLVTIEVERA